MKNKNVLVLKLRMDGLKHKHCKGGGGCSFGFGFQEPFNGDAISGLVKKNKSAFFLRICQLKRSGSALKCD